MPEISPAPRIPLRTVFFGSGDIGVPTLQHLLKRPDIQMLAVVAQPDKPAGRKLQLTPPPTKQAASEAAPSIPVWQPAKIREILPQLADLQADLYVVVAYGQILPKALLDQPKVATINLHASLLPRHRGAAPIQAAILAGDTHSGMTVMHVDVGLDSGDVILAKPLLLADNETGGSLHDKLARQGPEAIADAIDAFFQGTATRTPQAPEKVTHQGKLSREDGILDWNRTADELERRIRAFHPWPGTSSQLIVVGSPPKSLKIPPPVRVPVSSDPQAIPGSVLGISREGITIACGKGTALLLTQLHLEGRKCLPAADAAAGIPGIGTARFGRH